MNICASSVVICAHHLANMWVITYEKIVNMMCVDISHHNEDIKVYVQQHVRLEWARMSKIIYIVVMSAT